MIEKSYFIAPDNKNKNDKAYSLLVKVLTETKKIALGKMVLKDKEHTVALQPYQRVIVAPPLLSLSTFIPDHESWIVTMWHFGYDSPDEYTGEKFEAAWEDGQNA